MRGAPSRRSGILAAVLLPAAFAFCGAAQAEDQVSVFAGRQVSNVWEDVFLAPGDLEWRDSGIVGVAAGRNWPLAGNFSIGIEAQAVAHFGEQDHLEFNLPVFVRYEPERLRPFRGLAFGIGPSYATAVPEIEVETRGGSQRALLYWAIEAEFSSPLRETTIYTRLHHRSNGYGSIAEEGGSNIIVLGLRRRW